MTPRAGRAGGSDPGPHDLPAGLDRASIRARLHDRGLRWTPQRATLLDVLGEAEGHVTGAELVERCRRLDPDTTPSTVYRTLDVLEEIGFVSHSHGRDGREEFHVRPERDHGHLVCDACGATSELSPREAAPLVAQMKRSHDFEVDVGHLTVVGRCGDCRASD